MPCRTAAVAAGMPAVYSGAAGRWKVGARVPGGVAYGAEASRPAAGQMQSRRAVVGVAWRYGVNNGGRLSTFNLVVTVR